MNNILFHLFPLWGTQGSLKYQSKTQSNENTNAKKLNNNFTLLTHNQLHFVLFSVLALSMYVCGCM